MEGAERLVQRQEKMDVHKLVMNKMMRKMRKLFASGNTFLGQELVTNRAISPDLIRWENLGVTKMRRRVMKFVVYFIAFLILVFCASFIIVLSTQRQQLRLVTSDSVLGCKDKVAGELMLSDLELDPYDRNRYFICYCDEPSEFSSEPLSIRLQLDEHCATYS